jgi:hypothetical protein
VKNKAGKVIKKTPVIVLITLFVLLAIPTLGYLTLRSAAVQTYLASRAAAFLSRELGATITVGGVDISLFLNIVLEDVEMKDQKNTPLLHAKRMIFDISRISASRKVLQINKIYFEDANLTLVRQYGDHDFNFQFIADYFFPGNRSESQETNNWDVIVRSFGFRSSSVMLTDHNEGYQENGFDIHNFAFSNLNIDVRDIFFQNDSLEFSLKQFSFRESKGFRLHSLKAEMMISPNGSSISNLYLESSGSSLNFDMDLGYDGYDAFSNIFDDVALKSHFQESRLSLYELGYFIPTMYGLDGKVEIDGEIAGRLSNLRGNDIHLRYGLLTQFKGNFNIVGLPETENAFINLSVERLTTFKSDIESIRLPLSMGIDRIKLNPELEKFGMTSFNGYLTGFVYDFVAQGQFNTALGNLSTNIAIVSRNNYNDVTYKGSLSSKNINLSAILNNHEDFGRVAFSTQVQGKGNSVDNLNLRLSGQIFALDYRNYEYTQLKVSGNFSNRMFSGSFTIDDPNLALDFGGVINFREEIPLLNFTAQIENANLSNLNIYQRDSLYHSIVSTIIHVDGMGSNLSNLEGEINAYSTTYIELPVAADDSLFPNFLQTDVIAIENYIGENNQKELRFYSDFIDIQITGEMYLDKIANSLDVFFFNYIPSRFKNTPDFAANEGITQNIDFDIHIKNTLLITNLFLPDFQIAPHTYINGQLNTSTYEFLLDGKSEYLRLKGNLFQNPGISIASDPEFLDLIVRGNKLFLTDSLGMEQFFTSATIARDTMTMLTQWENYSTSIRNLGSIKSRGYFITPTQTDFTILPSYAYVNDSLWTFSPNNRISIDSTSINIRNFHLYKKNEFLHIDGTLSELPDDLLGISLNNFNLSSLAFLLGDRKVDFAGFASGELSLSNVRSTPNILTELLIKDFAFNNDHLGDLSLQSKWDAREKAFRLNAEVIYHGNVGSNKPIVANGYFYPERETDNFDIDISIENLKLSVFGRYFSEFASNFRGLASGKLRLDGPTAAPELSGRARLVRTGFRVDYLNTSYSFAHDLTIGKDFFRFDNLILNDTLGNSARASGLITHKNFFDFNVDLSLMPERLVVLNTQAHHNELFYGKAFASGIAHIHGPVNDIVIDIAATANRGTQIFLPLDYYGELTESSFISFISPDNNSTQEVRFQMPDYLGLSLNFDLTLTPEAEIQIIFDSQIGDIMRGRGFGDLKMEMDREGFFYMYGDYTIQEGDYLFTLQNLINKRFRMEQGGTIRWSGDPYDADIDIRALYRLRTSLFDLAANQSDTSDVYRRRVPVETVLHLRDKLFNPSISFEIQLPGTDETTRDMIDRLITTEQEMNRQVFSLLILNRFVPPEDAFNAALSYGMGSTSTELLSNQLSNWLSQISSDFDIGINYRPGDEISSQEVELALSTQLFDDRVVIDGNFGVAGNHPSQTQRTSNIIGDVNVEVKITPEGKFRVKAFNRSNTFDILNTNAPYTQGVGVFYRREFDNIEELFRRQRRILQEIPQMEDVESSVLE